MKKTIKLAALLVISAASFIMHAKEVYLQNVSGEAIQWKGSYTTAQNKKEEKGGAIANNKSIPLSHNGNYPGNLSIKLNNKLIDLDISTRQAYYFIRQSYDNNASATIIIGKDGKITISETKPAPARPTSPAPQVDPYIYEKLLLNGQMSPEIYMQNLINNPSLSAEEKQMAKTILNVDKYTGNPNNHPKALLHRSIEQIYEIHRDGHIKTPEDAAGWTKRLISSLYQETLANLKTGKVTMKKDV